MPLLHRFSCSTRTAATGPPPVGVGAPAGSPSTFDSTAFGPVAGAVHPTSNPNRQPTAAAHRTWYDRFTKARSPSVTIERTRDPAAG